MRSTRKAFTLIELLVVIAIIALLVSILLPALGKARLQARKTASLNNVRQINIGARQYCDDNNGFLPIVLSYPRGTDDIPPNSFPGWCTWSFGGKNCNGRWWSLFGGVFDVEAADRPLNPYMYPTTVYDAPPRPTALPAGAPERTIQEAPVFRDPGDKFTRQGPQWWREDARWSSYDDVGTSYHWSYRWFYSPNRPPGGDAAVFKWGTRQLRLADTFQPAKYVWVYDQTADIVVNNTDSSVPDQIINGFGDVNKSVSGFLDGHAGYITYIRRQEVTSDYTLLFTYQRR